MHYVLVINEFNIGGNGSLSVYLSAGRLADTYDKKYHSILPIGIQR